MFSTLLTANVRCVQISLHLTLVSPFRPSKNPTKPLYHTPAKLCFRVYLHQIHAIKPVRRGFHLTMPSYPRKPQHWTMQTLFCTTKWHYSTRHLLNRMRSYTVSLCVAHTKKVMSQTTTLIPPSAYHLRGIQGLHLRTFKCSLWCYRTITPSTTIGTPLTQCDVLKMFVLTINQLICVYFAFYVTN